jgi:hypothetical protein
LTIYSRQHAGNSVEVLKIQDAVLDEIANNEALRTNILANESANVNIFIEERMPSVLDFKVMICNLEEICNLPEYRQEVSARERIISSTLQEYSPKKIKLFVWEK